MVSASCPRRNHITSPVKSVVPVFCSRAVNEPVSHCRNESGSTVPSVITVSWVAASPVRAAAFRTMPSGGRRNTLPASADCAVAGCATLSPSSGVRVRAVSTRAVSPGKPSAGRGCTLAGACPVAPSHARAHARSKVLVFMFGSCFVGRQCLPLLVPLDLPQALSGQGGVYNGAISYLP